MISVVIPLYNKEASIAQSLKSVLSQEYDDFEVVIVDDGSTDGSVDVVEAMNDPRIRLIKQENGGPSKARNTGVKNAKGEWILFLDADDEMFWISPYPGSYRADGAFGQITTILPEKGFVVSIQCPEQGNFDQVKRALHEHFLMEL